MRPSWKIEKLAKAATERAVVEIQSDNLGEAEKWSDFGRKQMKDEIYITSTVGAQIEKLPSKQQELVKAAVDSLEDGGWQNSQIILPDSGPGGALRAKLNGNIKVLFRYAPDQHAIIVADVASFFERDLSVAALGSIHI